MRWVVPFVSFCAGSSFGVLTMCCVIANHWNEKEREVMADAGGSGKQDSEPCDHDHEAYDADDHPCGDDVPTAQEAGKGPEEG